MGPKLTQQEKSMSYYYKGKYVGDVIVETALKAYYAKPKKATPAKIIGYLVSPSELAHSGDEIDRETQFFTSIPTAEQLKEVAGINGLNIDELSVYRIDAEGEIKIAATVEFK
jgi:hypothetical protein